LPVSLHLDVNFQSSALKIRGEPKTVTNEELENSLRTEVDNYFKSAFADVQQEVEKLHESLNSEFERHRGEIENQFRELLSRDIQAVKIDDSFGSIVAEHIRIAREEGANETAEKFAAQEAPAPVVEEANYSAMRDAINDTSSQASQAEILKALVRHAGNFAPRGALFIVKSDHLIGWKVFGDEATAAEESVREVFLPIANDSVLSAAIKNQSIESGDGNAHADDAQFLEKLNFGGSQNALAIPLVVRGRGVAVLYADGGAEGRTVQTEALETLVRVAALTVELLAAAKTPPPRPLSSFTAPAKPQPARQPESSFVSPAPAVQPIETIAAPSVVRNGNYSYETPVTAVEDEPVYEIEQTEPAETDYQETYENFSHLPAPSIAPSVNEDPAPAYETPVANDYSADQSQPVETINEYAASYQPYQPEIAQPVITETFQPQQQTAATPRFGDRNVELPINVPEEERRLHNDARRFARLLVSEIKLYNEQKVKEGRQASDLYDRLREAVDRSREMYDKRVSPQVAGKFDYFHYELVNTLAEGDEARLGSDYPGATA
jgi:hypothetical protein